MFYRRKIILALLQAFGGILPQINLYKLLLIVSKEQQKPEYEFVPYMYGCYSFSLNADIETMVKRKILKQNVNKSIYKLDKKNYFSTLTDEDKKIILSVHRRFVNSTSDDLMRYTYIHYPYTAIRSQAAERLLSGQELKKIKALRPSSKKIILFTIGYEGISLEEYFNRLIKNNIKVLVDVRNNPVSMKFGFSKNQLKNYCEKLFIEYIHIPELGIRPEFRQELNTQSDYDKLFDNYRKSNLSKTISYQQDILNLLKSRNRVALTCFEANICQCHRKHLSDAITQLPGWNYELNHI
jgi:uncharacterized protein (DUF488 family)